MFEFFKIFLKMFEVFVPKKSESSAVAPYKVEPPLQCTVNQVPDTPNQLVSVDVNKETAVPAVAEELKVAEVIADKKPRGLKSPRGEKSANTQGKQAARRSRKPKNS